MTNIPTQVLFDKNSPVENSQLTILKQHFPNCFDKNGAFLPEKLSEIVKISDTPINKEAYSLQWLGKSYAKLLRDLPPQTLLCEDEQHNSQEENQNSQNLLIKGDNLEVLKHLKNAYNEKVKMIYIDPPYNTGSDGFVYQDDRKFSKEQLAELTGMSEDEAERVLKFTDKKSNSHSAWLTFMYPRLYIARTLLQQDGVIFISIDDNEVAQLRLLCDEVFGEENFVGDLTWEKKKKGTFLSNSLTNIKESILVYTKHNSFFSGLIGEIKTNSETYPCINASNNRELRIIKKGILSKYNKSDYFLPKGSEISVTTMTLILHSDLKIKNNILIEDVIIEGNWRYSQEKIDEYAKNGNLYITQDLYIRRIVKEPRYKTIKDLLLRQGKNTSLHYSYFNPNDLFEDGWGSNEDSEEELRLLMNEKGLFSNPKPSKLIKKLITSIRSKNMIIMDFFAGSGTTADAVMQLNAEDGGNRQFILVQLPELIDSKKSKTAYDFVKNELDVAEPTIFDITKERIIRSSKKILAENDNIKGDFGFKIYETVDNFCLKTDNELSPNQEIFPKQDVTDKQYQTLLTSWRLHDGNRLTDSVTTKKLADYTAYLCDKNLYLLHPNFNSDSIKALIESLDKEKEFSPNRIIFYGEHIDSSKQKELQQALDSYTNKKDLKISLLARY